ncbi:3-methyl-2-oxobutanoate hydroxymethyltransferase [Candidatus Bathyarchaeota archaeon]|nr:3-methyl-2-oxobutanoate hydroxymethyltransferase [Candidatus Bathyarchaeota archaeon]
MELNELIKMKGSQKVTMLTAYDYQIAKILDESGIDMILVGDSLGNVVLGYEGTKQVTMNDMERHIAAVARGVKKAHIIGDMPIASYNNVSDALKNAKKLINAGAHSVKLEGLNPEVIRALVSSGMPVLGHLGLLPQTAVDLKVKGKKRDEADRIFSDALELDKLGVYGIVLECIPVGLAKKITDNVNALTIGIGAGVHCDGQVLVINDMLGMLHNHKPKHVKQYVNIYEVIKTATQNYISDVKGEKFPTDEYSFH